MGVRIKNCLVIVLAMIIYSARNSKGLRILGIFPLQIKSHDIMCQELMRGLAAKGHQVDVYSHFPLEYPVPNYTDFSLKNMLPPFVNNLKLEEILVPIEVLVKNWFNFFGSNNCQLLGHRIFQKLIHNPPTNPPYDLIITEISFVYCFLAFGRHLNKPIVGVVSLPLPHWMNEEFGSPFHLATDSCSSVPFSAPMTFFERLHNVVHFYSMSGLVRSYIRLQDTYIDNYFGPAYPNAVELQKDLSLVLTNNDLSLQGTRSYAPLVVPVGGLHIVDRNETLPQVVKKWLDESKYGCIYFSFGSMTRIETFPKHIIDAFYKSFENIAPIRVLLKIAEPAELPPGLPANVLIQPWFYQIQVLKHRNIKAFVTHGGLMSTQESIYYSVPLLIIPLFADQNSNAAAYVKKQAGIRIKFSDITEESFTNGLKQIISNSAYRKAAKDLSNKFKDKPLKPLETAIYWIEYIHRHGKDALKSPIVDFPWWQAMLLDVYGFIAISVSLVFYVLLAIMRKSLNLLIYLIHLIFRSKLKKK